MILPISGLHDPQLVPALSKAPTSLTVDAPPPAMSAMICLMPTEKHEQTMAP